MEITRISIIAYRDVVREDKVTIDGSHHTKGMQASDYSFRIGGVRKFFVEEKKPSVGTFLCVPLCEFPIDRRISIKYKNKIISSAYLRENSFFYKELMTIHIK